MNTETRKKPYLWVANLCAFIAMVAVNILANALPIAGIATSQVSAMYPTLITPAGFTFAIWGLIYTLVGVWVISSLFVKVNSGAIDIGSYFIVICALDIAWLLAWHFQLITLSLAIILFLLFVLFQVYRITRGKGVIARTTFSIFYAWITVASIISLFAAVKLWNGGAPVTPIQPRIRITASTFSLETGEADQPGVSLDYIETQPAVQGDIMLINDEGLLAEGDAVPISVNGWDDVEDYDASDEPYVDTTDKRPIITGGDPVISSYAGVFEYVMAVVAALGVGALAIVHLMKFKDLAYAATSIWALIGIMYKQIASPQPAYISIVAIVAAIISIIAVIINMFVVKRKKDCGCSISDN